jgi:hypothetical protein
LVIGSIFLNQNTLLQSSNSIKDIKPIQKMNPDSQSGISPLMNDGNAVILAHFENNWIDSANGFTPTLAITGNPFISSNMITGSYSVHLSTSDYMYWCYGEAPLTAGTVEITVNTTSL